MDLRDALIEAAKIAKTHPNLNDKERHRQDRADEVIEWLRSVNGHTTLKELVEYGWLEEVAGQYVRAHSGASFDTYLEALEKVAQKSLNGSRATASKQKPAGDKWVSPGRLVLTWPDLDLTAYAVALVMAAHGDNKGENIWVSQSTIGEYLGRDRTTIYRAMKRLQARGVIVQTAKPRQHKPATWRINRGPRAV